MQVKIAKVLTTIFLKMHQTSRMYSIFDSDDIESGQNKTKLNINKIVAFMNSMFSPYYSYRLFSFNFDPNLEKSSQFF